MTWMRVCALAGALAFCSCYLYLPGAYDPLAVPLSRVSQVIATAGLLWVPVGAVWFAHRRRREEHGPGRPDQEFTFRRAAMAVFAIVSVLATGVALASSGVVFALVLLAGALLVVVRERRPDVETTHVSPRSVPLPLIIVPLLSVALQWLVGGAMADSSRTRAIAAAGALVDDLERHRAANGSYPEALTGVWPDYKSSIVGIDGFHYTRHGDSYTVHFEQPLPLLGAPGTREFVAYSPTGQHVMLSHASWHVTRPPSDVGARQGWYAARDLPQRGWKAFSFD